jgi:YggT family protein
MVMDNIPLGMNADVYLLLFVAFDGFLHLYLTLLLIRVSLTWFPNVNWYAQPFYSLSRLTDPYLKMFRGIVPPLIGIDISPILGFILLQSIMQIMDNLRL